VYDTFILVLLRVHCILEQTIIMNMYICNILLYRIWTYLITAQFAIDM